MRTVNRNNGCIGHVDHGKTTTIAAITMVAAKLFPDLANKVKSYENIDSAPEEKARGITINQTTVSYEICKEINGEMVKTIYSHVDCPGHADYVKNMIVGAANMNEAIIVVDASSGVSNQTLEHLLLAKQIGIPHMILYLNKCDVAEPEFADLVEEECKEALEAQGYVLNPALIFRGSSLKALQGDEHYQKVIENMLMTMCELIPEPVRKFDEKFKLYVEKKIEIKGRGTVLTGVVESGQVSINDTITLIGGGRDPKQVVVTGIEMFNKPFNTAKAGDNCGILLRGIESDDVERGMVLCATNSVTVHKKITGQIYLLKKEERGRHSPILTGYRPQFFTRTLDVTGSVTIIGAELLMPGDTGQVAIEFHKKIPIAVGDKFIVREGGITVASGTVTGVE